MTNPPRIWLDYRPIRIGWVITGRDMTQLENMAAWSACLWGGQYNPIIPMEEGKLSDRLIRLFGIDVLIPVVSTEATRSFIDSYRHLHLHMWQGGIFNDGGCEFVDIRHAAKRANRRGTGDWGSILQPLTRPIWAAGDALTPLFALLLGNYPHVTDIAIDYVRELRSDLGLSEMKIDENEALSPDWVKVATPLAFTGFDLSYHRESSIWSAPGVVLGSATEFEDLMLFWNLRAAGAQVCFYDAEQSARLKPFVDCFLQSLHAGPSEEPRRINIWSRAEDWPPTPLSTDLDVSQFQPALCRGEGDTIWNGMNVRPLALQFSSWHRDVVPSFIEKDEGASASFALPDRPFVDDDTWALSQKFVVTVDANSYGSAADDRTFTTPFVPKLNEFYGRQYHFEYDKARAEPGTRRRGAVGIISAISDQRLEVRAISIHQWMDAFFQLLGINVERSEPGLRCSRLIRQMGGLRGCRVLKVRGARELIREYGPDQSFTRSAAEKRIGDFDEKTGRMRFAEFENLYIQPRKSGRLTPGEVLQYMTTRGVFRVGLDFKCPNCELTSWVPLDDVRTVSTCSYCGSQFDVTYQLKDRDWRYRRSGLFGRDDNQLGGIPVTLALQQLETNLRDRLLICSTALEFRSKTSIIEKCEADFVAVVAGAAGINEAPIQLLFGEAKSSMEFDADDIRKLGKLADTVPRDMAETFILFAKANDFTSNEISLARTLNSEYRQRVILWSREELEPYHVYEHAGERLGQAKYTTTLTDMARVTHHLWFATEAPTR